MTYHTSDAMKPACGPVSRDGYIRTEELPPIVLVLHIWRQGRLAAVEN